MDFKNKFGFNCVSFNADSVLNKRDELLILVQDSNPDIIAVQEVYPKNIDKKQVQTSELNIPNYEFFQSQNPALGAGLYIKSSLKPLEVQIGEADTVESVWVRIRLCGQDSLLVGSVYRSPSSSDSNDRKIDNLLCAASESGHSHILVMGDFNHKFIDWSNLSTSCSENHTSFKFLEAVKDSFLHQHVLKPTHHRGEQTANILDLIFTNEADMIHDIHLKAPLGKSHHSVISFLLRCFRPEVSAEKPRFLYNKGNYESIRKELDSIDWDETFKDKDTEATWFSFKEIIADLSNRFIPKSNGFKPGSRPRKPLWMNEKALSLVKKKHAAFKRYLNTREGQDYKHYAKCRNQAKWAIRKAKRQYEKNIAMQAKTNPKAFYQYANSKLKSRSGIADLTQEDGSLTDSDYQKAEVLNKFFASVFTQEDLSHIPDFNRENVDILDNIVITEKQVFEKLSKLNPNKAQGPDNIHPRFLKETSKVISKPLAILFNRSLLERHLPSEWKDGNISPIFKKGNKSSPSNYRPVSLTSVVCKLMETILRDSLIKHMTPHFTDCQHGFLSGRSCITQLLDCLSDWTQFLENGSAVDAIYLDFAKAFDCVPHQRLLKKLEGYGVREHFLGWIKDFLENRRQRVVINGEASDWRPVTSGIPQGSVLGPILFICYVNDMPEAVQGMIKIFADDTKIYSEVDNIDMQNKLQNDLESLQEWANTWQMRFNASKCKCLHLGGTNKKFSYTMSEKGNTVTLEETTCEKDLGVNIDPELKFTQHCVKVANKASQIVGMIRRSFDYIDSEMLCTLMKGLIRPHLEYGNTVWSPRFKKDAELIENVQRRASKMVPELANLEYGDRLKALRLPSLLYRRLRGDLLEVYKLLNGLNNVDLNKYITLSKESRTRGHRFKLEKQTARKEVRAHFFTCRVVDQWNYLPESVVTAPSLNTFKNRLDKTLSSLVYETKFPLPLVKARNDHKNSEQDILCEENQDQLQAQ